MEITTVQTTINKDQGTLCSACGHFAGVYENCPRCGTYLPKRTTVKFFRYFSLFLATAGLLCLYLWAKNKELPVIQVKDITETMNFAYVRMIGVVTKDARISYDDAKKPSYLYFTMNDGTGEIMVGAYRQHAQKIAEGNMLPKRGNFVDMKGQLKIKAQNISLMIQAVEQFKIREATKEERQNLQSQPLKPAPFKPSEPRKNPDAISFSEIKKITPAEKDKLVEVSGKVGELRKFKMGQKMTLEDASGKIEVNLWDSTFADAPLLEKLKSGVRIQVTGRVDEYKGKCQINPQAVDDIQILESAAVAPSISLSQVTKDHMGQIVTISGKVIQKNRVKPGFNLLLGDNKGKIGVMLWDRVFQDSKIVWDVEVGKWIQVTGKVEEHKGKLQLQPGREEDVIVLEKAPEATSDKPKREEKPQREEKGEKNAPRLPRQEKQALAPQSFTHKEIVPIPEAEKNLPIAYLDFVAYVKKEHIGKMVPSEGKILAKEVLPNFGVKLVFQDRSGRIDVILPAERFQESELYQKLDKDYKIWVRGKVVEYEGQLVLQPRGDADIRILGKESEREEKKEDRSRLSAKVTITKDLLGQTVTFEGKVLRFRNIKMGKCLVVGTAGAKVDVVLLKDAFGGDSIAEKIQEGTHVTVTGTLESFQDRFEMKLSDTNAIQIVERTSTKKDSAPTTELKAIEVKKIEDLKPELTGKRVQLSALILSVNLIPAGMEISLRDDSGSIKLFVHETFLSNVSQWKQYTPGSKVQVTAKFNQGREKNQLELNNPQDLVLLEKGTTSLLPAPPIESLQSETGEKEKMKKE